VTSRLPFLGLRAAGIDIARLGARAMFAAGGIGFSVPFDLLIAGIAVPCFFMGYPQLLPLARFPGFAWIVAAGMQLPDRRATGA
jgi:hypothetical protein